MIRTAIVRLTSIPAIAYRQKLTSGGSTILRNGVSQPGIASISKTSGEAIPTVNTPQSEYPIEAFAEAIELTAGMPYKKLGAIKYVEEQAVETEDTSETLPEEVIVDSKEYKMIADTYTDKNGKLSYDLLNRDMIKLAHDSSIVKEMLEEMQSVDDIRIYVTGAKFREITGNSELTDAQILKITEMLDEVSPKGVLKEFNETIRLRLKESKRK